MWMNGREFVTTNGTSVMGLKPGKETEIMEDVSTMFDSFESGFLFILLVANHTRFVYVSLGIFIFQLFLKSPLRGRC